MKKLAKSLSCVLLAMMLALSVAVLPAITVYAAEGFDHPLSDTATEAEKSAVEELKKLHKRHIFSFDTLDFTLPYHEYFGDEFVDDPEAYDGKAAKMTAESRQYEKYNQLNLSYADACVPMYIVTDNNELTEVSRSLAGWQLIADGNYHLYKIEDVVAHAGGVYKFLYIFNDWGFQVFSWDDRLYHTANQKVDLYLSMKIEGDMSFQDPSNLPIYYIDRIIVTDSCDVYDIEYTETMDATCTENAAMVGTCPACGVPFVQYEPDTTLEHVFTDYTPNNDGTYTATCDYGCGTTDTIESLPEETTDAPADGTTDTTNTPDDDQVGTTDKPVGLSYIVLIILGIAFLSLAAAAVVVAVVKRNRKLFWILTAIAAALLVTTVILYLTGVFSRNRPSNENPSTGETSGVATTEPDDKATEDPTDETTGIIEETEPTMPALTEENSLDLGKMQIVLPATPTDVERNAAQELVDHIKKMTGETISVVSEGASVEAGIYIGDTEFAKANNVTHPSTEYGEGWAIKAVDGNLVLCGDTVRGPLYAVYHLLEDALDVHWWNYNEEYIPELEAALVWNAYNDSGAPAFQYRNMHPGALCSVENMYQVRNRLNGHDANPPRGFGGEEVYGSPAYVHSFAHYLPDYLFADHPEWFSLVNGQRVTGGQMCMTNDALVAYMTEELLNHIANDYAWSENTGTARPRWYSLCPNDYDMFCECSNCVAAIEKSGMSGYLLQFVNKIAEAVAVEYPEVLIDTLAYWQYIEPPLDDTKPAKNVHIRFACNDFDVLHSISHKNNAKALEWAKAWAELVDNPNQYFVWDYIATYTSAGPTTFMYKFPDHLQTLYEIGFTGYFGELENPINTDFWDMKMWLCAKLLEDPYQDFEALLDTFLNGYYGAAGPYVREYLDMAEEKVAKYPAHTTFGTGTNPPRWLRLEDVIAADEMFNKAFEAANNDPVLLRRLRLARNCLDRTIIERFDYFAREAAHLDLEFNLNKLEVCQRLVDCVHEQLAFQGNVDYTVTGGVNDYGWVLKYEKLLDELTYG